MMLENERIEAKRCEGSLSSGQESVLDRNLSNIQRLESEIEEKKLEISDSIEALRRAESGASAVAVSRAGRLREEEEDEDDEYYDRTKKKATKASGSSEPETEDGLLARRKGLQRDKVLNEDEREKLAREKIVLLQRCQVAEKDEDEVEVVVLREQLSLSERELEKVANARKEIEGEMERVEKMLCVINASWREDAEAKERATKEAAAVQFAKVSMPPPPPKGKAPVPPNREKVLVKGDTAVAPAPQQQSAEASMPPPPPKRKPQHPQPQERAQEERPSKKVKGPQAGPPRPHHASSPTSSKDAALQSSEQEVNWVPPAGQDGSGRTKLNEKFKGRY